MLDLDPEDSLTTLNTALNKSMVLMDSPVDRENRVRGAKTIKINTKAQPPNTPGATPDVVKSILKKSRSYDTSDVENSFTIERNSNESAERNAPITNCLPRPHNVSCRNPTSIIIEDVNERYVGLMSGTTIASRFSQRR